MVSPYSKVNFVDHSVTDQSSILRFIEDDWGLGRIGGGSYDEIAGSLDNLFDFGRRPHLTPVIVFGGKHRLRRPFRGHDPGSKSFLFRDPLPYNGSILTRAVAGRLSYRG